MYFKIDLFILYVHIFQLHCKDNNIDNVQTNWTFIYLLIAYLIAQSLCLCSNLELTAIIRKF